MKTIILLNYFWLIWFGISLSQVHAQPTIDVEQLSVCENVNREIAVLKLGNENLKLRLEMMDRHFERQKQHQLNVQSEFRTLTEMIQKLHTRLQEQEEKHHNDIKELLVSMTTGKECNHGSPTTNNDDAQKPEMLKELQKLSRLQEDILVKLDTKCPGGGSIKIERDVLTDGRTNEIGAEVEGISVCWGVYTKILGELSSNMTILQNIDSKLTNLNEQYREESEKHKKSIDITHGLLKFLNKKEDPKICVRSNDQQLLCTAEPHPTSCAEYDPTHCSNDKCRIKNFIYGSETFLVSCDDESDGGGWTVIQRRINGSVDFYRGWAEYKAGFGNIDGEFWIGLEKLHALTIALAPVELLIQLKDHNDTFKYAKYGQFSIGSELELYALKEIDDYVGNAGDSLSQHKGHKFSTKDADNDNTKATNCAVDKAGAWWYDDCQWSNLNGVYFQTGVVPAKKRGQGINWGLFNGYLNSMKFVQMMIRPNKK